MAFSLEQWATLRALYASGQYSSLPKLHEYTDNLPGKWPSIDSIKRYAAENHWEKGQNSSVIERQTEAQMIDMFAKHGMPTEKVVKRIAELMDGEKDYTALKAIEKWLDLTGLRAREKKDISGIVPPQRPDLDNLSTEELRNLETLLGKCGTANP